jgi:hypothetical protein
MSTGTEKPKKWRRIGRILFAVFILAGLGWLAYFFFMPSPVPKVELEIDRIDPGWRWADLQEASAAIPDEQNPAITVLKCVELIPRGWPGPRAEGGEDGEYADVVSEVTALPPAQLPSADQAKELETALGKVHDTLALAATLADFPKHGRFPNKINPGNPLGANRIYSSEARVLASLLQGDMVWKLQRDDYAGAAAACRGVFGVARAFGDDGTMIHQVARLAVHSEAAHSIERLLAQGQYAEPILAQLQKLAAQERQETSLVQVLRWERASQHEQMIAMTANRPTGGKPQGTWDQAKEVFSRESWQHQMNRKALQQNHADFLGYATALIEWLKQPTTENEQRLDVFYAKANRPKNESRADAMYFIQTLVSWDKFVQRYQRDEALLYCAEAALAAERYRLKTGHWPAKLEDLAPDFFDSVPRDPFQPAGPLRCKRVADGLIIYSVGPDGEDNGGNIVHLGRAFRGMDIGLRLWDVPQRRQPPPVKKPVSVKKAADD